MKTNKMAADIIKERELEKGDYSRAYLIQLIQGMSQDEFKTFCKEISLLSHHYDSSIETSACDHKEFIGEHPDKFFKHAKIDLDTNTGFRRPNSPTFS